MLNHKDQLVSLLNSCVHLRGTKGAMWFSFKGLKREAVKEIYPHISLKLFLLQELLKHWTILLKLPLGSAIVLPKITAHCRG